MNQILLSILIPTYNRSKTLMHTLDSIINQSHKDFLNYEVIVSNDCSTDDTKEVLELYKTKFQSFKVFNQDRNIHLDNWNFLLGHAKGEFVFLLCDDDAISPEFFEVCQPLLMDIDNLDILFSGLQLCDAEFRPLTEMSLSETPEGITDGLTRCRIQLMSHHMVMSSIYRRSALSAVGGWDSQVGTHFDCNAFCRVALRARKTLKINRALLYFRISHGSWSHQLSTKNQLQLAKWYRRKLELVEMDATKFAPDLLKEMDSMYCRHVWNVLAYLEIELAYKRIRGAELRATIKALLSVFPESRNDRQVWKLYVCSIIGTKFLQISRKLFGKSNPYASSLSLFNDFSKADV